MDIENNAEIQYIIYCRKSTDETSEHQKQSIPDQIKACIDYAEREGLIIAKKPENFQDFETENDINREDTEADIESRRVYQSTRDLFIIKEQETGKIPYKRKKWRKLIERIKK